MKLRRNAVILFVAAAAFAATAYFMGSGLAVADQWTDEERNVFLVQCRQSGEAHAADGTPQRIIHRYCDCVLDGVVATFPDAPPTIAELTLASEAIQRQCVAGL